MCANYKKRLHNKTIDNYIILQKARKTTTENKVLK